jgi:hypothetical protein
MSLVENKNLETQCSGTPHPTLTSPHLGFTCQYVLCESYQHSSVFPPFASQQTLCDVEDIGLWDKM